MHVAHLALPNCRRMPKTLHVWQKVSYIQAVIWTELWAV